MNVIEQTLALIAPHRCIICGFTDELLCSPCQASMLISPPSRCYRCHALTRENTVCISCKSSVQIKHVWAAVQYKAAAKELIYRLKFGRAKAGAGTIAAIMAGALPRLPEQMIASHIPTANNRVRLRGHDQSQLIAKSLCRQIGRPYYSLLHRTGKSRQVGSSRRERFVHLEKALHLAKGIDVNDKHILLIDDVTTTGATIEAAAKVLKAAGAKTVDIAVFAQAL